MNVGYTLKAIAILALLAFSLYMAEQNKDDLTRKRWKNIIAFVMLTYLAGKQLEELSIA